MRHANAARPVAHGYAATAESLDGDLRTATTAEWGELRARAFRAFTAVLSIDNRISERGGHPAVTPVPTVFLPIRAGRVPRPIRSGTRR